VLRDWPAASSRTLGEFVDGRRTFGETGQIARRVEFASAAKVSLSCSSSIAIVTARALHFPDWLIN